MSNWPTWNRPDLSERMLVSEERRLAARGLTPEQARADVISFAASLGGETMAQCVRAVSNATDIDPATISNFLRGRQPIYGPLLDALYGAEPLGTLPDDVPLVSDWGPMLPDAIAAGLATAPEGADRRNPEPDTADEAPPSAPAVPVADNAGHDPDAAEAATPAVANPQPPPATIFTNSQRDSEGDSPATARSEGNGATQPADVGAREAAGAPTVSSPEPAPLPHSILPKGLHLIHDPAPVSGDPFEPALAELMRLAEQAVEQRVAAEQEAAQAEQRLQLARLNADALMRACNDVHEARQRALALMANPPVQLDRRAA